MVDQITIVDFLLRSDSEQMYKIAFFLEHFLQTELNH